MTQETQTTPTNEEHQSNTVFEERRAKLAKWRAGNKAYPNDFFRNELINNLQLEYGELSKEELKEAKLEYKIAGRIMARRGPFLVLQDMSGKIQLYVDKKNLASELLSEIESWDIGDIIGAQGFMDKSNKGDLYLNIQQAKLLSKNLRPLPEKFHGLTDQEMKYRQRYVDLMVNEKTRDTFQKRSQIVAAIRQYMVSAGFMEVETPMLQPIPGGATARPFITKHNALDQDMYLRIAPELYLKRLVVGGFEKVFEINRNFRNEGLSTKHNPEFTMLEFYCAFITYEQLMLFTEKMLRFVAVRVLGTTELSYQGEECDLAYDFDRLSMKESIVKYGENISLEELSNFDTAKAVAEKNGIEIEKGRGLGWIINSLFEELVEDKLRKPTFITQYPAEVSPLARRNDEDPSITDRFEFFMYGREIANGFSELNDPEDQKQRFLEQVAAKEAGDNEAMYFDDDYIRALEYALPPTGGQGIGIDRLVMLFTDSPSIRDVLLFPAMRHANNS